MKKLTIPGKGKSPQVTPVAPIIPSAVPAQAALASTPAAPVASRLSLPARKPASAPVPSNETPARAKPAAGFNIAPPKTRALSSGPVSGSDALDRMASDTVAAAKRGLISDNPDKSPARINAALSIGSKLVGALRGQAIKSARADQQSAIDPGAVAQVWQSLLELLSGDNLMPVIYCSRSGRPIQMLTPESLHDFCAAIARLGDSQSADAALLRLYDGTIRQMAHSYLPQYLTISADTLAIERELLPVDFLLRGIGKLFPAPAETDFLGRAQWVNKLASLRNDAEALPIPVIHFLCEIVTIHLAHIDARRLPYLLRVESLFPNADWSRCLSSVASAGHLAARLVQHIFGLLAARENKPIDRLSRFDLLHLKTAYKGHAEFGGAYRRSRQQVATAAKYAMRNDVSRDTWELLDNVSTDLALDFGLSDLLDLQAAAALTGRAVSVHVQTPLEVERAQKVRAASVRKAAQASYGLNDDEPAPVDEWSNLDLSGLMSADILPEDFITIDTESDLVALGLITADEAESLDLWGDNEDHADDDESAEISWQDADALQSDLLAATLESAMADMKPLRPR